MSVTYVLFFVSDPGLRVQQPSLSDTDRDTQQPRWAEHDTAFVAVKRGDGGEDTGRAP